jgi:hypothetical protein
MDEAHPHDRDALQMGRLFADLMLTLAEDGVRGAEAVALTTPLATALQDVDRTLEPDLRRRLTAETAVAGLTLVSGMLADMLVAERRERGQSGSSLASVWSELLAALEPPQPLRLDGLGHQEHRLDM